MHWTIKLVRLILHLLRGLFICAVLFPRLAPPAQRRHIRQWSRRTLDIVGLELEVVGQWPDVSGLLVVSNHISWLDIYLINAVYPVRFIAKSEVRRWPLIGWLCAQTGTLFIERTNRKDAHRLVHHMAELLTKGQVLSLFPEGTTSDGRALLPFHANLYAAALSTGCPVLPIGLTYLDQEGQHSTLPAYVGEMTLLDSIKQILRAKGLVARIAIGQPLYPQSMADTLPVTSSAGELRRRLATQSQEVINQLRHPPPKSYD